jgi:hypothetical protein
MESYAWNVPPVSRSSSLAAGDLLRQMVAVLTESLQAKGWSVSQISDETRRVDETIREVASSFDGDLVALQQVGIFFLEIKCALEGGLVSEAKGGKEASVESIAAGRIDDSLAAMGLLRERYEVLFKSLRHKGWSEAKINEEGKTCGQGIQDAVSAFDPKLIRLGRTWVFLQEALLRASEFPSDSSMSGKAHETRKEVGPVSRPENLRQQMGRMLHESYLHRSAPGVHCAVCGCSNSKYAFNVVEYAQSATRHLPAGFVAMSESGGTIHGSFPLCAECAPICPNCGLPRATRVVRKLLRSLRQSLHSDDSPVNLGVGVCTDIYLFDRWRI